MFSSKNKLTEDQLREGILSKILGAILDKRVSKVLSVADIENNPALKRAVRNADKAVKQLDKTLQGSAKSLGIKGKLGKTRGVKFAGTRKGW